MVSAQNRDYNKSLTQVYNVATLLHCACCSTRPIYLLGRWRQRLSLVCNNQNHVTSLKMLMVIGVNSYYSDLMDGNYRADSGLLARKMAANGKIRARGCCMPLTTE